MSARYATDTGEIHDGPMGRTNQDLYSEIFKARCTYWYSAGTQIWLQQVLNCSDKIYQHVGLHLVWSQFRSFMLIVWFPQRLVILDNGRTFQGKVRTYGKFRKFDPK